MPDTYGAPLLSEILPQHGACVDCGAALPPDDVALVYEDFDGEWAQRCSNCSMGGVEISQGGQSW